MKESDTHMKIMLQSSIGARARKETRPDTRPGISREWSPLADFSIDLPDIHTYGQTEWFIESLIRD